LVFEKGKGEDKDGEKRGKNKEIERGKKKHMERQKEFECMLFNIELLVQVLKL